MARILVIDDNTELLEMIRLLLEEQGGHEAILSADGAEGLAAALADPPDLAIVDEVSHRSESRILPRFGLRQPAGLSALPPFGFGIFSMLAAWIAFQNGCIGRPYVTSVPAVT